MARQGGPYGDKTLGLRARVGDWGRETNWPRLQLHAGMCGHKPRLYSWYSPLSACVSASPYSSAVTVDSGRHHWHQDNGGYMYRGYRER